MESITFQRLGSRDFWRFANSVLNKGKSAISPLLNGPEVLSSKCDKAKFFVKNFSKNFNLDDSGISLPVFPDCKTNQLTGFYKMATLAFIEFSQMLNEHYTLLCINYDNFKPKMYLRVNAKP